MHTRPKRQKVSPNENMKSRVKIGNAVLAIVAIFAVVFAIAQARRSLTAAAADERACAELLTNNAAIKVQIGQEEERLSQMDEKRSAERNERLRQAQVRAEAQSKSFNEQLKNDHEFALKYYATKRSKIDRDCGPFLYSLRLPPEQRDAIAEVFFAQALRLDLMERRLRAGELSRGDQDTQKKIKEQAQGESRDAIAMIAGERVVQEVDRYERARPAWNYVNALAAELALGPTPLNLDQAARLASAIAEGSESFRKGGVVMSKEMDWERVDAKAQTILSARQFEFFAKAQIIMTEGWSLHERQNAELMQALEKIGK